MSGRIQLGADRSALRLEPGASGVVALSVANRGPVVDTFSLAVSGVEPAWYSVVPAEISLFPQAETTVTLAVHPPPGAATLAGDYALIVTASSRDSPADSATVELNLHVEPISTLTVTLDPQRVVARRGTFLLRIGNAGNAERDLIVRPSDPDARLVFTFGRADAEPLSEVVPEDAAVAVDRPAGGVDLVPGELETSWSRPAGLGDQGTLEFGLPLGTMAVIPMIVAPKRRIWTGPLTTLVFEVTVTPPGAEWEQDQARQVHGQLDYLPYLEPWSRLPLAARRVIGFAVPLLLFAAIFFLLLRPSPAPPGPILPPTPDVGATLTAFARSADDVAAAAAATQTAAAAAASLTLAAAAAEATAAAEANLTAIAATNQTAVAAASRTAIAINQTAVAAASQTAVAAAKQTAAASASQTPAATNIAAAVTETAAAPAAGATGTAAPAGTSAALADTTATAAALAAGATGTAAAVETAAAVAADTTATAAAAATQAQAAADGTATPAAVAPPPPGPAGPPAILAFNFAPAERVEQGVRVTWVVTNADRVTLNGRPVALTGSQPVTTTLDQSLILIASNPRGEVSRSLGLLLLRGPEILVFEASRPAVPPGGEVILNWRTVRATSITLNGQPVPFEEGGARVRPNATTDYLLIAENIFGQAMRQVRVTVPTATAQP